MLVWLIPQSSDAVVKIEVRCGIWCDSKLTFCLAHFNASSMNKRMMTKTERGKRGRERREMRLTKKN